MSAPGKPGSTAATALKVTSVEGHTRQNSTHEMHPMALRILHRRTREFPPERRVVERADSFEPGIARAAPAPGPGTSKVRGSSCA